MNNHIVSYCANNYALAPLFKTDFNNIIEYYNHQDFNKLKSVSECILTEEEFYDKTCSICIPSKIDKYKKDNPKTSLSNNEIQTKEIKRGYSNTFDTINLKYFYDGMNKVRNKLFTVKEQSDFKKHSPTTLIHFNHLYSTRDEQITESTNIFMFEFDNFEWKDGMYISDEIKQQLTEYFTNRKDTIALTRSISDKGFHIYISVNGVNADNFESCYFYALNKISVDLNFHIPIWDTKVGSKSRKDNWSQGVLYHNKESEYIFDFNEIFKDEMFLDYYKKHAKDIKKYNTIPVIKNNGRIDKSELIYLIELFKTIDEKYVREGYFECLTEQAIDDLIITGYRPLTLENIIKLNSISEKQPNKASVKDIKSRIKVCDDNVETFLNEMCQNMEFSYKNTGTSIAGLYINILYNFNITHNILKSYFIKRIEDNGFDFEQIRKKYDDYVWWKLQVMKKQNQPTINPVITKDTFKNTYERQSTEEDERHLDIIGKYVFLESNQKLNPSMITDKYLYLKADTKSGKTVNVTLARLLVNDKNQKVILIVPMVDIAKEKEMEFNDPNSYFRKTLNENNVDCKIQIIHGPNEEKGYENVSKENINMSCNLFISTLDGYIGKLYDISAYNTHLILDEIHSYLQFYTMKKELILNIFSKIQSHDYKTITVMTGTPITSEFYKLFDNYSQLYIRYKTIKKHPIIIKPKVSLVKIVSRIIKDYHNGKIVMFFNNSRTVQNLAIKKILIDKGILENEIFSVDSKNSILKYNGQKIIISTTSFEMGVELCKRTEVDGIIIKEDVKLDKIYINPDLYSMYNLVAAESLVQMVNRTDRQNTINEETEIMMFTSLIDKEGRVNNYTNIKDKFIERELEIFNKAKMQFDNHEPIHFNYIPIVELIKYDINDFNSKEYIKYKLGVYYDYLNINSFFNTFNNQRYFYIKDAISDIEINNNVLIKEIEDTDTELYKLINEYESQNEKEVDNYIIDNIVNPTKYKDYNNRIQKYDDILFKIQSLAAKSNLNINHIHDYIINFGYRKAFKDLNVFYNFKNSYKKTNLSYLYEITKNRKVDSIENILIELQNNGLFLNYNTKNIQKTLHTFGISLKLNMYNQYIMSFGLNMLIEQYLIKESPETFKQSFTTSLTKKEILNLPIFKELDLINYTEIKKWNSFLNYVMLNNIEVFKIKTGTETKYSINVDIYQIGKGMTKKEWIKLANKSWNQIKIDVKNKKMYFDNKQIRVNGKIIRTMRLVNQL
jgi:hypothetical protein